MTLIKSALNQYAATRETTFAHDRTQTLGASEVGQCSRKSWYVKNAADPQQLVHADDEHSDSWGARMRGTVFEEQFWVPAMRAKFRDRLRYAGNEQTTFIDGFLSATPDGMLVNLTEDEQREIGVVDTTCVMVECKTVDPRTNLTEAKAENTFQVQVQMGLVRRLTPYRPTHSIISYTDASWWNDVKEYVIAFDPAVFAAAEQRALQTMTADRADELRPEGWIAGGNECRYCAFTQACGVVRRDLPFEDINHVDPQFAAEITDLARQLKRFEATRDKSDAEVRDLQDLIKTRLREKKIRRIPGVVSWSSVKGRASYDNKALKAAAEAAGIDVEQFATMGEPGDRLVIQVASTGPADAAA